MPGWLTRENIRWVFRGSDGLRAGWSLLIFVAIFAIIPITLHILHIKSPKPPGGELPIALLLIGEAAQAAFVLGITAIMMRFEKRGLAFYGFDMTRAAGKFGFGLAWGFGLLSLVVGVLWAGGFLVFDGVNGPAGAAILHGLVMAIGFCLVAVSEESLNRGYMLATLARGIGFWPASVVTSALFAAGHIANSGESIIGVAQVFVAGMLFCTLLRVSGSLWVSIGFHAAWDWAQSFFYGTPDSGLMFQGHFLNSHAVGNIQLSGGPTGPEASLLATPLLLGGLAAMVFALRGGARGQTVQA